MCIGGPGPDRFGVCDCRCDALSPACGEGEGCYPLAIDATGVCRPAGTSAVGQPCAAPNQCVAGAVCVNEGGGGHCAALCGGSSNVACADARTCTSFGESAPTTTAGYCR